MGRPLLLVKVLSIEMPRPGLSMTEMESVFVIGPSQFVCSRLQGDDAL